MPNEKFKADSCFLAQLLWLNTVILCCLEFGQQSSLPHLYLWLLAIYCFLLWPPQSAMISFICVLVIVKYIGKYLHNFCLCFSLNFHASCKCMCGCVCLRMWSNFAIKWRKFQQEIWKSLNFLLRISGHPLQLSIYNYFFLTSFTLFCLNIS